MKKHIGYKVEATLDFGTIIKFVGFITYFDGRNIIVTRSSVLQEETDAWKWIGDTLAEWEAEGVDL